MADLTPHICTAAPLITQISWSWLRTSFTSSSADPSRYSVCFWNKYFRFGPLGALISWSNNRKVGARVGGSQPESPRRATKAQRWAGRLKQQTHSEASEVHEQWKYFVHVEAGFMDGPGERWASGCSSVDYRLPEYSLLLWKTKPTFNSLLTSSEEAPSACAAVTNCLLQLNHCYDRSVMNLGSYEWSNWLCRDALYTLHTYIRTSICCILIWRVFIGSDKEALSSPPLLLSTTTLTAAPRGNHSEMIIGIQFGFVNVDRALLDWDTRVRLKWSSAFSCSVASLSSKLLSSASADRRASHSSLKGLFFFFLFFCPFPVRGEVHGALSLAQPFGSVSGSGLKNQQPIFPLNALGSVWLHKHEWDCANTRKPANRSARNPKTMKSLRIKPRKPSVSAAVFN